MLNVHGRHHIDAGLEDLQHVLVALVVTAAGGIRVRELVDHTESRLARKNRVEIHFFQYDAAVLDLAARDDLQVAELCRGLLASVRLDEPDHDVDAFALKPLRVLDHRVGLADARRGADVDAQAGALGGLQLREHLIARRPCLLRHRSIVTCSPDWQLRLYELFMAFCQPL